MHLLACHVLPETLQIVDLEGHDVLVRRGDIRAEQAANPMISPVFDRGEGLRCRVLGLQDPALVLLRAHALLEVY